jgi:hypothetical protein
MGLRWPLASSPRPRQQPTWSCERLGWAFTGVDSAPTAMAAAYVELRAAGLGLRSRKACPTELRAPNVNRAARHLARPGPSVIGSDRRTRRHPRAFTGWKRPRGVAAACGQGARARRFSRDTFRGSSRPCVVGFFPALAGGSWNGRHISAWARVASSRLSRKDWLRRTAQ